MTFYYLPRGSWVWRCIDDAIMGKDVTVEEAYHMNREWLYNPILEEV